MPQSAAHRVVLMSSLCQKHEQAMYEQVRAVHTNNEWIQPCSQHYLWCEQFIACNTKIFIEIVFWSQIRNKNSTTREPKANLIAMENIAVHQGNKMLNGKMHFCSYKPFVFGILFTSTLPALTSFC